MTTIGYVPHEGKILLLPGISTGAFLSSYSCNGGQKLRCGTKDLLSGIPSCSSKRISAACNASSNNYKGNHHDSKRIWFGGKSKQYQEPELSENTEETNFMSSKNGSLPSQTRPTRYQATMTPKGREMELLDKFLEFKDELLQKDGQEKKTEGAQKEQSEREIIALVIEAFGKHPVDQKKNGPLEAARSSAYEDEQNVNRFGTSEIKSEKSHEPLPLPSTRPISKFNKKSPIPRMKLQPVFSAEEDIISASSKSQRRRKETGGDESKPAAHAEPVILDGPDELSLDNQLDSSGSDGTAEETVESSATKTSPDLSNLKLSALKDLAKSRGIKGYSKLRKGELVELLSAI